MTSTNCARCSCSRSSPTSSWTGCAAKGTVELVEPGWVYREGDPATCFYVLLEGVARAVAPRRRGRRRGQPYRSARRLRRSVPGLPRRPDPAGLQQLDAGHRAVAVLRARRRQVRGADARVVPDGAAPARGVVLRHPEHPAGGRATRTPARPRLPVRRPDPRAEQPGRGGRARHLRAARPGRRHAAQAGVDRRRAVRPGHPRDVDPTAGGRRRARREGTDADSDGGNRPRGRARRLVRVARHRRRLGPGADVRPGGPGRVVPGQGRSRGRREPRSKARSAGSTTPSRPNC